MFWPNSFLVFFVHLLCFVLNLLDRFEDCRSRGPLLGLVDGAGVEKAENRLVGVVQHLQMVRQVRSVAERLLKTEDFEKRQGFGFLQPNWCHLS